MVSGFLRLWNAWSVNVDLGWEGKGIENMGIGNEHGKGDWMFRLDERIG